MISNEVYYGNEEVIQAKDFAFDLQRDDICVLSCEPKTTHITSVVETVKKLNMQSNLLEIVAYLHDLLDYAEDVETRKKIEKSIIKNFDENILKLVKEASDGFKLENISTKSGKLAFEQRYKEIKTPGGISDIAAIVIIAEKVCNLQKIAEIVETQGSKTYWRNLRDKYNLDESEVAEYYAIIYDSLSLRCYNYHLLRGLINLYDQLLYKVFNI